MTKPEHPLVIFIDDLRWLDTATLDLLERLVTDPEQHHLMIIGAYRDDEVSENHPLFSTLTSIRHTQTAISEITLGPLKVNHLVQLAADALSTNIRRTRPLAKLILREDSRQSILRHPVHEDTGGRTAGFIPS